MQKPETFDTDGGRIIISCRGSMQGMGTNMAVSQVSSIRGWSLSPWGRLGQSDPSEFPCPSRLLQCKARSFDYFLTSRSRRKSLRWRHCVFCLHQISVQKPQCSSSGYQTKPGQHDEEAEERRNHDFRIWRRNDQNHGVKIPRNLADRRLNPRTFNPQKSYPTNPRYFTKPIVRPRGTYPKYTRSTDTSLSELGNRKSSQNISEKQDPFESFSNLDEPESETYLRKLLNARLAKTKPAYIQEFDEEDEEDVEDEDEENGGTFKTPTYARRKYESEMPEKPSVNLNETSDEKALRKALKLRRRETQEVLKEHLMEGSLSLRYSQAVVDNMPGFVDHIMVQAVALRTQERYVTSTFIARARACVAQTKLIDIVKWMKHNHITIPRVGKLIDLKGQQLDILRERIGFLKQHYVRGRDLGVVLTRYPIILDRPWEELYNIVQLLEDAGVRREWIGFVICRSPKVLTISIDEFLDKISFFQNLGVTTDQFGPMAFNFPASIGHFSLPDMQKKVEYLRQLGIVDAIIGKMIATRPQLLACDVEDWRTLVKYFQFLGVQKLGIQRILSVHPSVFCMNLEKNIAPKVRFLRAIGIREEVIGQVIVEFPALLSYSLDRKIRPVVKFILEEAGVKEEDIGKVIALRPELIGTSLTEKLHPLVQYFRNQQFKREEVGRMVADFPMLLKYNVAVIQPKFRFFKKSMNRPLGDLLAFPRYFSYSLKGRIIPRQQLLQANGLVFHLRYMLGCNDDIFSERVKSALEGRAVKQESEDDVMDTNYNLETNYDIYYEDPVCRLKEGIKVPSSWMGENVGKLGDGEEEPFDSSGEVDENSSDGDEEFLMKYCV